MTAEASELIEAALALPARDRVAIVHRLLDSLGDDLDEDPRGEAPEQDQQDIDAAWATEITRRVETTARLGDHAHLGPGPGMDRRPAQHDRPVTLSYLAYQEAADELADANDWRTKNVSAASGERLRNAVKSKIDDLCNDPDSSAVYPRSTRNPSFGMSPSPARSTASCTSWNTTSSTSSRSPTSPADPDTEPTRIW